MEGIGRVESGTETESNAWAIAEVTEKNIRLLKTKVCRRPRLCENLNFYII